MKKIETEVCAYSVESCLAAAGAGATRVELCSSPFEGGTTPSPAAIRMACGIEGLEAAVMVRPRGGDFLYTELEFEQMKREIEFAKECGAECVVLGILNPDGTVDTARTAELVRIAAPMEVAFHRAIDTAPDIMEALEAVISTGCARILTSGGKNTAQEGLETIRAMAERAAGRIEIMAGSGVNPANAAALVAAGVDALHFSAKAVRQSAMRYRGGVPMSSPGIPEWETIFSDPETIRKIVAIADAAGA